ncbi:MAG: hypothetical protein ACHQ4H_12115 [Ktedonobacterales bacterium]
MSSNVVEGMRMLCPRCGYPNERFVQQCARCGLPFPADEPRRSAPEMGGPIDGVWRDDDTPAVPTDERPPWLRDAMRGGPAGAYGSGFSSPASSAPFGRDSNAGEARPGSAPNVSGSAFPATQAADPGRMIVDASPRSDLDFGSVPSNFSVVGPVRPASGPLVPSSSGTLKNGRYRILQRMHSNAAALSQGGDPPLLVAGDTEVGNQRVLVQELAPVSASAAEMEAWRRASAERLEMLAQRLGAPRVLDHFADSGRHFLVYELPSGNLLLDRIQRTHGPLDEKLAIGIALQLLDVLDAYEHQYPPFIHGNISPANIILRPGGQLALIGFSPSLLTHPDGHVPGGAAGGVAGYAAPEQARGQASSRSDLFSLCGVLHHAVTGSAPSPRARGMFPPARQLNPNISLELEDVLGQGLRLSSTQRFQSSAELRHVLMPLSRGQLTHVPEELREDSPAPGASLVPVRDARGHLVLPRRRKLTQNPMIVLAAIITLIALIGGATLVLVSPRSQPAMNAFATPTTNPSAQLFQAKGIGLSGGEYIFDTTGADNTAKQQGARALNAGDLRTAEQAFTTAVAQQPEDAEAAIYAEDVRLLLDHAPYITIVAAVTFADADQARQELQGVYLAQRHANALDVLPYHLRVRVLVLNSGQDPADATAAANLLLQQVQVGNTQHLAGIVGWPENEQTRAALSALAPSGLAVLSPTASAPNLGGRAASFFPLVPSDTVQAQELALAAATQLGAQRILVLSDPSSATSVAERTSFLSTLKLYPNVTVQTADYKSGDTQQFQQVAGLVQYQGDDLIFFAAGDTNADSDSLLLAAAIGGVSSNNGAPPRILVTHQAYTPALLGIGNSDVAATARNQPSVLRLLDLTLLASPNEWQVAGVSPSAQPSFSSDYNAQFGANAVTGGIPGPTATSILSFDAARMLLAAAVRDTHSTGSAIQYAAPTQVRLRLLQFNATHPFVGVGGALAYTDTGDLAAKSVVIARLAPESDSAAGPAAIVEIMAITGGVSRFCGSTTCTPS